MNTVTITPNKITLTLITVALVMAILNVVSYFPLIFETRDAPIYMFNLDAENNLPALFSTSLLWLCAIFSAFIAATDKGTRIYRYKWTGIALTFFFLGIDESVCLHERLNGIFLRDSGILTMGWILPYTIILLFFSAIYLKFLFEIPPRTRLLIIVGGALFVTGALVIEYIGGRLKVDGENIGYYLMVACEELLEMSGCIVFIRAFTTYIDDNIPEFRLRISTNKT